MKSKGKSLGKHFFTYGFAKLFILLFFAISFFNNEQAQGQSLCSGLAGTPIVFKHFGAGTTRYSTATPESFGFSTTYWQRFTGQRTNDSMFSFQNNVTNDFNVWHNGITDHTPGDNGGYLMMVNADYLPGEFYRDTVEGLCVGSSYNFSVFLGNVFLPTPASEPPNVKFEIRSATDGTLLATTNSGPIPPTATFAWKEYGLGFTSKSTSVVLLMVSDAPGGMGNDIAIDDITFTPCVPATTAIKPINTVCNDSPATIEVSVFGNADYKFYRWEISRDNGTTWSVLGAAQEQTTNPASYTVKLEIPKVSITDNNTTYRLVVATNIPALDDIAGNCKSFVYSQTTILKTHDPVLVTFPNTPTMCVNSTPINLNTTTPAGGVFSGPNVSPAGLFTPSTAGNFKVVYTLTNSLGCVDTASRTIKVQARPTADAGPDQQLCAINPAVTLNGKSTNSTAVIWTGGAGNFNPDNRTLTATYTPTSAEVNGGLIKLTLINTDTAVCPPMRDQVEFSYVLKPIINFPDIPTLCAGGSPINLNNLTPLGGTFTGTANVSSTGVLTPTTAGTFNVDYKISNGLGCEANVTKPVTIQPRATVDAGPDQLVCAVSPTVTLNGIVANSSSRIWVGGKGTFAPDDRTANATYTATPAEISSGSVTLTFLNTDSSVCPAAKDQVKLSYAQTPEVVVPDIPQLCAGGALYPIPGLSPSGGTISGTANVSASGVINPSTAGSFTIQYKAVVGPGCVDSVIKPVIVLAQPTVNAGQDQEFCTSSMNITLSASSANTSTVLWRGGDGAFSPGRSSPNATYVPTSAEIDKGIVNLTFFNTDTLVCPRASDNVVLTIEKKPVVNAGPDQVLCTGISDVQLAGKVTNAPGSNWSGGPGSFTNGAGNVAAIYHLNSADLKPGTITLTLVNTGSKICTPASDQVDIKFLPVPKVQIPDTGTCIGNTILLQSVILNASEVGSLPLVYEWKKEANNLNQNQSAISIKEGGTYKVKASYSNCSTEDNSIVEIYPLPVDSLQDLYKFCEDNIEGVELNAGPGATYVWTPGGETTRKITVHTAGTYQVLIATEHQCTLETNTNVVSICPPRLFISNSFSPNKDGTNEKYNVYGAHFTNFKMFIFNRWGEVIFETSNRNIVWDGEFRQEQMPVGVYPWIITYEGDSQEYKGPYKKEGSVTVVR